MHVLIYNCIAGSKITIVPDKELPIEVVVSDLELQSNADLSVAISEGSNLVGLSAKSRKRDKETVITFTPPYDTTAGTRSISIGSFSCLSSKVDIVALFVSVKASVTPSIVDMSESDTLVSILVENAPDSTEHPFSKENLKVVFGTVQASVVRPVVLDPESTRVVVRAPVLTDLVFPNGVTEIAVECQIYRFSDPTQAGATFSITYRKANSAAIVDKSALEESAIGSHFGGKKLRVEISNFPQVLPYFYPLLEHLFEGLSTVLAGLINRLCDSQVW